MSADDANEAANDRSIRWTITSTPSAKALALPMDEAWRPAVQGQSRRIAEACARLVDEFALPDETEPASVFTA